MTRRCNLANLRSTSVSRSQPNPAKGAQIAKTSVRGRVAGQEVAPRSITAICQASMRTMDASMSINADLTERRNGRPLVRTRCNSRRLKIGIQFAVAWLRRLKGAHSPCSLTASRMEARPPTGHGICMFVRSTARGSPASVWNQHRTSVVVIGDAPSGADRASELVTIG